MKISHQLCTIQSSKVIVSNHNSNLRAMNFSPSGYVCLKVEIDNHKIYFKIKDIFDDIDFSICSLLCVGPKTNGNLSKNKQRKGFFSDLLAKKNKNRLKSVDLDRDFGMGFTDVLFSGENGNFIALDMVDYISFTNVCDSKGSIGWDCCFE